MAVIIQTADLRQAEMYKFGFEFRHWIYNGLDCAVTLEVHEKLQEYIERDPDIQRIYAFSRALQGPAFAMMQRGFRVDEAERAKQLYELRSTHRSVNSWLQRLANVVESGWLNYNSHIQLKALLYEQMHLPVQYIREKGVKKVSTNRECLEKLKIHYYAIPIINCVLALRDIDKQMQVLSSGIDSDGRLRASFNIAGTKTGRWSSSKNCYGRGTNLQNISEKMRRIFIADPGEKLAYPDLEQAESRVVAYLSQDLEYIKAHESGDLHTYTARLIWPNLDWTGDIHADRKVAEQPYYRHFSYRDLAKRGGHASNYYAMPFTVAKYLKLDIKVAEEFQDKYFDKFFMIPAWHRKVQNMLLEHGTMVTAMGRRRTFFGRPNDDATLREAIAHEPQSVVVDILNFGLRVN